jgi:hypothetical protein
MSVDVMSCAVDELDPRVHLLHRIHKADIEPDGLNGPSEADPPVRIGVSTEDVQNGSLAQPA